LDSIKNSTESKRNFFKKKTQPDITGGRNTERKWLFFFQQKVSDHKNWTQNKTREQQKITLNTKTIWHDFWVCYFLRVDIQTHDL
jgi:hypoxanthine phosphoribosyltransferase